MTNPGPLSAKRVPTWRALDRRIGSSGRPTSALEAAVLARCGPAAAGIRHVTTSVDAVRLLVRTVLPGWWVSSGICDLTGHASLGPDYNGPHRERLLREFPIDAFDAGFHADLAPGADAFREALAVLSAFAQAMDAVSRLRRPVAGKD